MKDEVVVPNGPSFWAIVHNHNVDSSRRTVPLSSGAEITSILIGSEGSGVPMLRVRYPEVKRCHWSEEDGETIQVYEAAEIVEYVNAQVSLCPCTKAHAIGHRVASMSSKTVRNWIASDGTVLQKCILQYGRQWWMDPVQLFAKYQFALSSAG